MARKHTRVKGYSYVRPAQTVIRHGKRNTVVNSERVLGDLRKSEPSETNDLSGLRAHLKRKAIHVKGHEMKIPSSDKEYIYKF